MSLLSKARALRQTNVGAHMDGQAPAAAVGHCAASDDLAAFIEIARDAWHERIAVITADAPDVSESEARHIAEAEIGRRFVEAFMHGEVAS